MPSNIDKKFIENLQDFTESLENVVELMKQQSEKGGDAVNKMLSALDGPKLSEISEDIKAILDTNKKIDNRTKEILEEIKASRKQKETGMFDKISNKENKHKIRDSIQTIILISGGVLAIGMAFKLIGKVDFLSVVSLSLSLLVISHAFAEISKVKELTPKNVFMVGLAIVGIATAITVSSLILKMFQPLDPIKMFSFVLVSAALGVATMFIFKSIKDMSIKPKDMVKYLLLPLILPAIATSIALSSFALQYVQPVGIIQAISAVFTGLALVAAAFAVKMVMMAIGKLDSPKDLMKIGLAVALMPLLAGGIFVSSWILNKVKPLDNPFGLALTSLAIGISLLAFAPTVYILGKMKISQLAVGALGAVLVSGAILASSWIISFGKYDDNYPSLKWAAGVGLSLILFTPAVLALGIIAMSGIGALAIVAGAGMTLIVAAAIVGTSYVLNEGVYKNYPSAKWSAGVGLSLLAFTPTMLILGVIPFGGKILRNGADRIKDVAQSIVDVADILGKGNYKGGPTKEWAEGIGLSLTAFSQALKISLAANVITKGDFKPEDFSKFIMTVAKGMIDAAEVLSTGNWSGGYPSAEWGEGVGKALTPFINIFEVIGSRRKLVKDLVKGGENNVFTILMKGIAKSMVDVANIIATGDFSKPPGEEWATQIGNIFNAFVSHIPEKKELKRLEDFIDIIKDFGKATNKLKDSGLDKLNKLTASVTIMSVIDDQKLNSVIKVLDTNKDNLSNVLDSRSIIPYSSNKQKSVEVEKFKTNLTSKSDAKQDEMIKKFDSVLEKFDELLEYVVQEKSPTDTGKEESTK
jgi:hypothetical protein